MMRLEFFIEDEEDYDPIWRLSTIEDSVIPQNAYNFIKDIKTGKINFNGSINIPSYIIKMFYTHIDINKNTPDTELYKMLYRVIDKIINDKEAITYD